VVEVVPAGPELEVASLSHNLYPGSSSKRPKSRKYMKKWLGTLFKDQK
jgi:hypothetical protein